MNYDLERYVEIILGDILAITEESDLRFIMNWITGNSAREKTKAMDAYRNVDIGKKVESNGNI